MKLSVIIPALNEGAFIERTLKRVASQRPFEVIVADGGSSDDTVKIAKKYAKVVKARRPWRSVLMNAGASVAKGDVLVFLHPDTLLPDYALKSIPDSDASAFWLSFDADHWLLRFTAWYANNIRLRRGMVFGDHCLCIRKVLFDELGGFKAVSAFEDVEFSERLRKLAKISIIRRPVVTSARRYLRKGVFRQWFINQKVKLLHKLGASPDFIRRVYRG